jgi:hypothetical protein
MWCKSCDMQYCLHCGEKMGTLVKWHKHKTCQEFLQEADKSKAALQRRILEVKANEAYATSCLLFRLYLKITMCPSSLIPFVSNDLDSNVSHSFQRG